MVHQNDWFEYIYLSFKPNMENQTEIPCAYVYKTLYIHALFKGSLSLPSPKYTPLWMFSPIMSSYFPLLS